MRTPTGVAQQIRDIVPEEHKERFTRLARDFSYKAVEQRGYCWKRLAALCNGLLGGLPLREVEDWQVEMIAILTMVDKETLLEGWSI